MQCYPNRLPEQLNKGLLPYYLVFGDEPQQKLDAIEAIRAAARGEGYSERLSFTADGGFNWSELIQAGQAMSLFAERQIIELELPTAKPGAEGSKALTQFAELANPDLLLIVHGPKAGKDVQNTKWFKRLDKQGLFIPCYPLEDRALHQWVQGQFMLAGLKADADMVGLLCEHCEGNLLAAKQEIQKLAIHFAKEPASLTREAMEKTLVDQSRFTMFQLMDLLLAGDQLRAFKVLTRLESEGIEANAILWAMIKEHQTLKALTTAVQQGQGLAGLWQGMRIWKNRQSLYLSALKRLDANKLEALQAMLTNLDVTFKTAPPPRPYIALAHLSLAFLGADLSRLPLPEHD